jgi:hypothetical protein
MQRIHRTALRRGAQHADCAAQHACATRTREPGLLGGSSSNRPREIATDSLAHSHDAGKARQTMRRALHWGLTFDMSGRRKRAKHACGCPLDGGVRCHCAHSLGQTCTSPRRWTSPYPRQMSELHVTNGVTFAGLNMSTGKSTKPRSK